MVEALQERPLVILVNPAWSSFDQENFEPDDFFAEAKITDESVRVFRARFRRFASPDRQSGEGALSLTLRDFQRLNQHYSVCRGEHEEHFFRAMGRNGRNGWQRLSFDDFLLGCSAASPATPHILNSLTGFVRARYIFDYYNSSRSGTLEFEELAWLLADARRHLGEESQLQHRHVAEVAQELGEVEAVTLRVLGPDGTALCDVRASRHWTDFRVRQELARELRVPVEGQKLCIGSQELAEGKVLGSLLETDAGAVDVTAVLNWEGWPHEPEPLFSDGVAGVERLVHVPFEAFYRALAAEQLRGMSRLFRFRRPLFNTSKSSALSTALAGGA